MLQTILHFVVFFITILLLVTVHEWGHFFVAKRCGIKVLKFSVGFGRPLWRRVSSSGTEYAIAWLPIGGYVKLLDEREGKVADNEKHLAFNRQPLLVRSAVVIAGPLVNFLFAFLIFWLIWIWGAPQVKPIIGSIDPGSIAAVSGVPAGGQVIKVDGRSVDSWSSTIMLLVRRLGSEGNLKLTVRPTQSPNPQVYNLSLANWQVDSLQPDLLKGLGIMPYLPPSLPIIKKVKSDSPAAEAGLMAGDKIIAIDDLQSDNWVDFARYIQQHPKTTIQIVAQREQKPLHFTLQTQQKLVKFRPIGYIGVEITPAKWPAGMQERLRYSPGGAFIRAAKDVWSFTEFNFIVLAKIVIGDVSLLTLGGPIAIFQTTNLAFAQGVIVYAGFLAVISVMLACLNVLPIPGLDGSHLLFFLIEKIIRRPISIAVQVLIFRLGFIALMFLIVQSTVNDLMRIFQ